MSLSGPHFAVTVGVSVATAISSTGQASLMSVNVQLVSPVSLNPALASAVTVSLPSTQPVEVYVTPSVVGTVTMSLSGPHTCATVGVSVAASTSARQVPSTGACIEADTTYSKLLERSR